MATQVTINTTPIIVSIVDHGLDVTVTTTQISVSLVNVGPQGATGPAGGVNEFNGRQGDIVPQSGDYSISQITGAGTAASKDATYFDLAGAAAIAQATAEAYADDAANSARDNAESAAQGYASTAQSNAETFATSAAHTAQSNAQTAAQGYASTAQSNAETFATNADSVVLSTAESFATSAAHAAQSNAEAYADNAAATAQSNAETYSSDASHLSTGTAPMSVLPAGTANGLATLNAGRKLTASQLPSSVVGAVVYQGTWNASTNNPSLASSTGTKGFYYKVNVAGTTSLDGVDQWNIGDTAIFDGSAWSKIDGIANEVVTVFGRYGSVTAESGDYDTSQVTESDNLYFTAARAIASTLTGFVSGAGTVSDSDSILSAIQKLVGNLALLSVAGRTTTDNSVTMADTDGIVNIEIQNAARNTPSRTRWD